MGEGNIISISATKQEEREESCSIGCVFCMSGSFNDNTAASMGWMEVIYGGHLFFPNTRELYCYLNTPAFSIFQILSHTNQSSARSNDM